jgi:hypothetical protein
LGTKRRSNLRILFGCTKAVAIVITVGINKFTQYLKGKDLNITEYANKLAQAKAAQYGYVITNPSLVSTRPIDMPNYGFLPSKTTKRTITR